MGKFRKNGKKGIVPLSTASLPDIVFMLLFFFMVATVLRTEEPKVRIDRPELNEIYTLKKKHLIRYVNVGTPMDSMVVGTATRIQLNDKLLDRRRPPFKRKGAGGNPYLVEQHTEDIRKWVMSERDGMDEQDQRDMWISMQIDAKTPMGLMNEIKDGLRMAKAYKVLYSAESKGEQD